MLSKQGWRLITNPDSLCARVLKAKYYPNVNLLQATLKNGASFTWQSIMKGLETFKLGYIWRIGTGENVNIWSDPWVPASPDRKVISNRGQTILSVVSDLIDPHTGAWDEPLIRSIFNPVDARRIMQIPINHNAFDDFIAWNQIEGVFFQFVRRTAYNGFNLFRRMQMYWHAQLDQTYRKYGLHCGNCRFHVRFRFFVGVHFMELSP